MKLESFCLEVMSFMEIFMTSSFIFNHSTIILFRMVGTISSSIVSAKAMLLMRHYIMSYYFLMVSLAGIMNSMLQAIQDGLHSCNTPRTDFTHVQMNSRPFYVAADYFKLIWWICLPVLTRNIYASYRCNSQDFEQHC